jgi:hypothetical protein
MAAAQGYELRVEETTNVKHSKASILLRHLPEGRAIWMDSDSMICKPFDDLLERDFDIALPVKEPEFATHRYGHFLYSGFIVCNNTAPTRQLLSDWHAMCNAEGAPASDQRNLHEVLDGHLDESLYTRHNEIVDFGGLKVALLDPFEYCHLASIKEMCPPVPECRVIHFKGALHKKWPEYKRFLCS